LSNRVTKEQIYDWLTENGFTDLDAFGEHLRQVTRNHRHCLNALLDLANAELRSLGPDDRLVASISPEHQTKSPEDVVEKVLRSRGKLTLRNCASEMDDLVRFRVLCNYLGDVERVVKKLASSSAIKDAFDIVSSEDRIWEVRVPTRDEDVERKRGRLRLSGVRAHYFVFQSKQFPQVKVEVQVATLLEHAWDQKDHHLVYEPERRGETVSDRFRVRVKAVSDLLYVADEYLEALRAEREGGGHP